jgi:Skp family chaperone for outer membrane proteins
MKSLLQHFLPGLALAGLLALPAPAQPPQPRIAIVDLRKVFENYHEKVDAEAAIKLNADALEKDFKGMVTAFDKLNEDYNKLISAANDQSVSAEERDKRKNAALAKLDEIGAAKRALQSYQGKANTELEDQKKRLRDKILGQIRTVIDAKAKAAGYTLVLDSTADSLSQAPVVLYTNGDNDLTDKVLETLNAASPAAVAAPPAGGGPKKDGSK